MLLMVAQNPRIHSIFLESYIGSIRSFRSKWIYCPNCDWFFAGISRKYKKWAIFDILIIVTREVNMITRKMTPFFSIYSLSPICLCISFLHFKTFKIQFHWVPSPFCVMFWSVKFTHLHAKDNTFKPVNIYIFFSTKKMLTFVI